MSTQDSPGWQTAFPNQLPALIEAMDHLDNWLQGAGADENARYVARLACEELGTNIIKYGYDDPRVHTIVLRAVRDQRGFRIGLEDDGHEFNPCLSPEPDPKLNLLERTPGGWGISLVRRLSAGLHYERRGDRNIVYVLVANGT